MVQSFLLFLLLRGSQETSQKVPPYLPGGGGLINPMLALLQKGIVRDFITMCIDICTINTRVSIRVRGLHLVF